MIDFAWSDGNCHNRKSSIVQIVLLGLLLALKMPSVDMNRNTSKLAGQAETVGSPPPVCLVIFKSPTMFAHLQT